MGFYLIGPLVTLIPLGSISSWAFKPYCDDGLLGISPLTYICSTTFQSENIQFPGGEVLQRLRGHFPPQDLGQARGVMCPWLRREVPEALHEGWHEVRRD